MRKNKMMRLASALLVLTLLTTSIISGTFAKYTTQDSAGDVARVAKWGVVLQAAGSLYGTNYQESSNTITNGTEGISVKGTQIADTNVIAPGTKNETGMSFSINGTPEVSTFVQVKVAGGNVFLAPNNYGVMVECEAVTADNIGSLAADGLYTSDDQESFTKVETNASYNENMTYYTLEDAVTVANDYYPVEYTLTGTTSAEGDENEDTMSNVLDAIDGRLRLDGWLPDRCETGYSTETTYSGEFDPNTDFAETMKLNDLKLSWMWDYENDSTATGDAASAKDRYDTILGHMMAMTVDEANSSSDMKGIVVYADVGTDGTLAETYAPVVLSSDDVSVDSLNSDGTSKTWTVYYVVNSEDEVIASLSTFFYIDMIVNQVD